MGKSDRYDLDGGSSDTIGGGSDSVDTEESSGVADEDVVSTDDKTSGQGAVSNSLDVPPAGEAGNLRTNSTNHLTPESFSMSALPHKQRRSNVKEDRGVDITASVQEETKADIKDARRKLEDELGEDVPKTDLYEIIMIAGANDDLSLLDAANIIGYIDFD